MCCTGDRTTRAAHCSSPEPTATLIVVVETVVVTVIPTLAPTEVPPPTAVPPTQPPAPTPEVVGPTESGGPVTVDDVLGAGWFVNMTRTADAFRYDVS